jgi:hypothetical protein
LGFVKRGYQDVGSNLTAQGAEGQVAMVKIAALPFV